MLQGARRTFGSRSQIVLVQELRARIAIPAVTSVRFEPSLTIWCWWKLVGLIHKLCYLLLHWNILGDHSGLRSKRVNCSIGGGRDLK